ncbi:MAG TPA: FGGY family carbohydrate kinase [Acidothermaceae bacterium]
MWIGLDFGTSATKAVLVDSTGTVRARGSAAMTTTHPGASMAEQDADDYTSSARAAIAGLGPLDGELLGIGLSGHTPSVVLVDTAGRPLRPVLTWQDTRAELEAVELAAELGDPVHLVGTSLPWAASACPAKLRWLAEHESWIVDETQWVLQPKDYVGLVLTGSAVSDPWSSKGLCHVGSRAPAAEVMAATGWPTRVVPTIADGQSSRGALTDAGARLLGLPAAGVAVSVGWSDAMAGMLSVGALTNPSAFVLAGTSSIVGMSVQQAPADAHPLYVIPDTCAPSAVIYGPTQASGASIEWLARLFDTTPDRILEAASVAVGPIPIFVPYLAGERAPVWRTDVRAVFAGLDLAHGFEHLASAVVHGVAFGDRHVLEVAAKFAGETPRTVRLGGHTGADPRWHSARLRTLGTPILAFDDVDPASRGAAMLGMAASGVDLAEAVERVAAPATLIEPSAEDREYATREFASYLRWVAATLG